jgi:hypothetical protein
MRAPELEESLRSEPIIDLVSNLHSPDDTVRQASEQTLQKGYRVSKIGAGPVLDPTLTVDGYMETDEIYLFLK